MKMTKYIFLIYDIPRLKALNPGCASLWNLAECSTALPPVLFLAAALPWVTADQPATSADDQRPAGRLSMWGVVSYRYLTATTETQPNFVSRIVEMHESDPGKPCDCRNVCGRSTKRGACPCLVRGSFCIDDMI